jgi:hypothetical protein
MIYQKISMRWAQDWHGETRSAPGRWRLASWYGPGAAMRSGKRRGRRKARGCYRFMELMDRKSPNGDGLRARRSARNLDENVRPAIRKRRVASSEMEGGGYSRRFWRIAECKRCHRCEGTSLQPMRAACVIEHSIVRSASRASAEWGDIFFWMNLSDTCRHAAARAGWCEGPGHGGGSQASCDATGLRSKPGMLSRSAGTPWSRSSQALAYMSSLRWRSRAS